MQVFNRLFIYVLALEMKVSRVGGGGGSNLMD